MKNRISTLILASAFAAILATPLAAWAHPLGSPRHSDDRGRQDHRYHEPPHRSQPSSRCFWSVPPPCPQPVAVYSGYYPPPVAYRGYYPPPPPPPPPVYYYPPCPRPGFNFVFSF